jgi:hypothetical protein
MDIIDQLIPDDTYEPTHISKLDSLISRFVLHVDTPVFGLNDVSISRLISRYMTSGFDIGDGKLYNMCGIIMLFCERVTQLYINPTSTLIEDIRILRTNILYDVTYYTDGLIHTPDETDTTLGVMKKLARNWIINKFNDNEKQVDRIISTISSRFSRIGEYYMTGGYGMDEFTILIQTLCDTYTTILKELNMLDHNLKSPEVHEEINPFLLGSYSVHNNILKYAFSGNELVIDAFITNAMTNKDNATLSIKSDKTFGKLFSAYNGSVIMHELEHYRRQSTHYSEIICGSSGGHNSTTEDIGGITKERSFDECIVAIYELIIKENFIDRWMSAFILKIEPRPVAKYHELVPRDSI